MSGGVAVVNLANAVCQLHRIQMIYDRFALERSRVPSPAATAGIAAFLHLLYARASLSISILYALIPHTLFLRGRCRLGRVVMGILDGVSLLLAVALFVYLLVALLRADRN